MMPAPLLSERDLAALRSFAGRIDAADAGAHNNLGVLYFQKGLIPEAVTQFQHALELDPRMAVAQGNLEIAYRENGHYDQRVAELRERLRSAPDDRAARWELARAYAALQDHDASIAEFEAMLAAQPTDTAVLLQLGRAEAARGGLEAATEWFAQACRADPESAVARFSYGEALYNRGLNDPALEALQSAVARNGEYADAHYLLAFVHGDMGNHEAARAAAKRAVTLNPALARAQANLALGRPARDASDTPADASQPIPVRDAALAHFNLGLAFRQKGYLTEALREYRLALESGEERRLVLQAMAEVQLLRRELNPALEIYESLVAEVTDSPKLWSERGVCLQQLGQREAAEQSYLRAVDLDPDYVIAWNNLGVLRAQEPMAELTLQTFRRATRSKRVPPAVRLNLALLHFQRRELQPALEYYRAVLADEPSSAVGWNGIGLVLMELKRYGEARTAFQRAVDADPESASAHYNLSFTLSQLGDFDGALHETKRALELEPFYVPQKYTLALDVQYEHPDIAVPPPVVDDMVTDGVGTDFEFDPASLDQLFQSLEPKEASGSRIVEQDDPLALARDYVAKGLLELATAEVGRARARGADSAAVATLLGEVYARRGLHGEALERFREARLTAPGDTVARLGEVRALTALGRGTEALGLAEEVAALKPHDPDVMLAHARAALAADDPRRSLTVIREALARSPGNPDLYQLQAMVSARLGDLTTALEACHLALRVDGGLVQIWRQLGQLEEMRDNWTGAQEAYQRALDILPTYAPAAHALADLVRRIDSPRRAIAQLIDVLEQDPYDFEALVLLAQALLDNDQAERSLEAVARVLRFQPDNAAALFHRGVALARLRRFADAVKSWDRVTRVAPASALAADARAQARSARDLDHILIERSG